MDGWCLLNRAWTGYVRTGLFFPTSSTFILQLFWFPFWMQFYWYILKCFRHAVLSIFSWNRKLPKLQSFTFILSIRDWGGLWGGLGASGGYDKIAWNIVWYILLRYTTTNSCNLFCNIVTLQDAEYDYNTCLRKLEVLYFYFSQHSVATYSKEFLRDKLTSCTCVVSNTYNKRAIYKATLLQDKLQAFVARISSASLKYNDSIFLQYCICISLKLYRYYRYTGFWAFCKAMFYTFMGSAEPLVTLNVWAGVASF